METGRIIGHRSSATFIGVDGHRIHQGPRQLPDLPDIQNKGQRRGLITYIHENQRIHDIRFDSRDL
jgi:hypothetical protein